MTDRRSSNNSAPSGTVLPSDSALAVANRLRPVLLRIHRQLRGEAHELGVTSTQATLLGAIHRSPGVGMSELAAREQITPPTLVGHIDRLERAGLVARTRDQSGDRRRVGLALTPAGEHVLATLRERRTAWLATRLETLSLADLAVIEAAIEALSALIGPAS
ncbi:MAG TPA: MarR family transcriptional regulator [Ktedonobacterales bacterium]